MKKNKLALLIMVSICILAFSCIKVKNRSKFPVGKDTVEFFSNGRFQLMKSSNKTILVDMLHSISSIETDVYNYKVCNQILYVIGKYGYTVIDLNTEKIKQLVDLGECDENEVLNYKLLQKSNKNIIKVKRYEDFNSEEKKVFEKLQN